jgi:UDP-N-acetylglucosamine 2-epimerase (non-hydrolysing)
MLMVATPCIDIVAGARPNFMKVAPILRAFAEHPSPCRVRLIHTGQHYDETMSAIFFAQLGIPAPSIHLGAGSGAHGAQTARVLAAFEEHLLRAEDPSCGAVVVGDVNSTMACALAAVKLGIPVAHVEAGLRSFDRTMPEEINRIVTDAISDVLFVSEPSGAENLTHEGISVGRIHYVGNVMIDSLVSSLDAARALDMPRRLGLSGAPYAYVTLHRPANVDDGARLEALVGFLRTAAHRLPIVFPVHPRTRRRLKELQLLDALAAAPGVRLLDPLGYRESLGLMASSRVVITDSGGVQEETTYLEVPCLTLRSNTERPATVTHGTNSIVGTDLAAALDLIAAALAGRHKKGRPIPGWDGQAASRIVSVLYDAWRLDFQSAPTPHAARR